MTLQIKKITKYVLNGVEYNSLLAVQTKVENDLGSLIDKMSQSLVNPINSSDKMKVFEYLVLHKDALKALLSIELDQSDDWQTEEIINILDLK